MYNMNHDIVCLKQYNVIEKVMSYTRRTTIPLKIKLLIFLRSAVVVPVVIQSKACA